jgi:hypothetical protein
MRDEQPWALALCPSAEKAGAANAGAEPLERQAVTGSSDTPLFPGRGPARPVRTARSAAQVQAALRALVGMQRKLARGEYRRMLAASVGPASQRARAVLEAAAACGLADAWAFPAATVAMLLPGEPVAPMHDMDGNARLGLWAAAHWLTERGAPDAVRFVDYLRGATR